MKLDDLINTFRLRAGDTADPPLWTDEELLEFADDAHNEAAERASLLRDTMTAEICEVAVVAGTASYLLDPRILRVERAKLDLGSVPLGLSSTDAMDRGIGLRSRDWRTQSTSYLSDVSGGWDRRTGTPSQALLDQEQGRWRLTLVPKPVVNDTLRLQVIRLPLASLSTVGSGTPEIPPRLHIRLVDWMEYRAYSKQDTEVFNMTKAVQAEATFTRAFGERIDANARRTQNDRTSSVVQFREF